MPIFAFLRLFLFSLELPSGWTRSHLHVLAARQVFLLCWTYYLTTFWCVTPCQKFTCSSLMASPSSSSPVYSAFFVTQLHDTSTVNNLLGRCRECFALFILSWSPHLLHSAFFLFKQFFFVPVSWGLSWFDYVKWIFCWFTSKMIARATVDTELCNTWSLSYWVCGQFISSLCVKNTFKSDILY